MWKKALVLPLIGGLAACSGSNDRDPLTRMDRYARIFSDTGSPTSDGYIRNLDGTFTYIGTGVADFQNVSSINGLASHEVKIVTEFNSGGTDYMSGEMTEFVPVTEDGRISDVRQYEGRLLLSKEAMVGGSATGNVSGQLRYREDGTGGADLVFGGGTEYNATIYDNKTGSAQAQYLRGRIDGCFGCDPVTGEGGEEFDGYFAAER
jgi:hypothetical protein